MDFITILFIGVGLAMDACAVSLAKGMSLDKDKVKKYALILALAFGFFQALMPAIGYFAGSHFADYIQSIDHWIAFILLSLIGINMIKEGKEEKEDEVKIDAFKISDIVRQIQDIFSKIDNCLSLSWDDYYELAVEYYKEYGNLLVPANYSKNGMNLGCWITDQRKAMKGQGHRKDLTEEQIKKLESIGIL